MSVAQLLEGLQMALDFENVMASKYGVSVSTFRHVMKRRCKSLIHGCTQFAELLQSAASPLRPGLSSRTTLSSAFEQYMNIFVDAQDKYGLFSFPMPQNLTLLYNQGSGRHACTIPRGRQVTSIN